jgi:quinol monooxygenase YgiN
MPIPPSDPVEVLIVTGSVVTRPEHLDDALAVCLEHVRRSRSEAGGLSHAVHQDAENPNRLVFFEQWADRRALENHFRLPSSGAFIRAVAGLATEPPTMTIYRAHRTA